MRDSCLNCTRKHLSVAHVLTIEKAFPGIDLLTHIGQAEVLFDEFMTGDYDSHFWLSVGHLARIENYLYSNYKTKNFIELADLIREERVKAIDTEDYRPNFFLLSKNLNKLVKNLRLVNIDYECGIKGNMLEAIEETTKEHPELSKKIFAEYKKVMTNKKDWKQIDFLKLIETATELEE